MKTIINQNRVTIQFDTHYSSPNHIEAIITAIEPEEEFFFGYTSECIPLEYQFKNKSNTTTFVRELIKHIKKFKENNPSLIFIIEDLSGEPDIKKELELYHIEELHLSNTSHTASNNHATSGLKAQDSNKIISDEVLTIVMNYVDKETQLKIARLNRELNTLSIITRLAKSLPYERLIETAKKANTHKIVPAFNAKESPTVKVAKGIGMPAQEISTEDFSKSIKRNYSNRARKFIFTNDVYVPNVFKTWAENNKTFQPEYKDYQIPEKQIFLENIKKKAKKRLKRLFNGLIITKINDKIGYGLCSDKFIMCNSLIGCYSGKLTGYPYKNYLYSKRDYYCFSLDYVHPLFAIPARASTLVDRYPELPEVMNCSITAKNYGNEMSFMLDAPTEAELDELIAASKNSDLDTTLRQVIAKQNVTIQNIFIDGMPLIACITLDDIKPGEMLFINYGKDYWKGVGQYGVKKCLFTRKGTLIDLDSPDLKQILKQELDQLGQDNNNNTCRIE